MNNQKKDVSKYFHDTLTLMKNYRDALWNVEVAERNLHAEFHAAYGASNRASFDDLALPNPHLEGYAQSISRSKKMLSVIDSSVNLMREKHKKGELYYWILYYSYLSPQRYENANEKMCIRDRSSTLPRAIQRNLNKERTFFRALSFALQFKAYCKCFMSDIR